MSSPYLILAPTQHSAMPSSPTVSSPVPSSAAPTLELSPRAERSDSLASNFSANFRFLKLGPVYFGGEPGVSDYAD